MGILSVIADVTGIAGFVLTTALLVRSESLRIEVESQRQDYIKEQVKIRKMLSSLRDTVFEDGIVNERVLSDIRTELFSYRHKFKRLLNREDKRRLKRALELLDGDAGQVDRLKLRIELDYFVARFHRKEKGK